MEKKEKKKEKNCKKNLDGIKLFAKECNLRFSNLRIVKNTNNSLYFVRFFFFVESICYTFLMQ